MGAGQWLARRFRYAAADQVVVPSIDPSWVVFRREFGPGFFTPNHFRFGKAARSNQQFRMDVMRLGANIKSLKDKDVLEEVYVTERGDARRRVYRTVTANLTDLAGKTVRLRFAVVVTEAQLNVGVDAVKVKTKPQG